MGGLACIRVLPWIEVHSPSRGQRKIKSIGLSRDHEPGRCKVRPFLRGMGASGGKRTGYELGELLKIVSCICCGGFVG
jgi:hypothetical protein